MSKLHSFGEERKKKEKERERERERFQIQYFKRRILSCEDPEDTSLLIISTVGVLRALEFSPMMGRISSPSATVGDLVRLGAEKLVLEQGRTLLPTVIVRWSRVVR